VDSKVSSNSQMTTFLLADCYDAAGSETASTVMIVLTYSK